MLLLRTTQGKIPEKRRLQKQREQKSPWPLGLHCKQCTKEGRRQTTTQSSPIALATQGIHNIVLHCIKAEYVLYTSREALLPLKLLPQMRQWTKLHFQQLSKLNIFINCLQTFQDYLLFVWECFFFSTLTHRIQDFFVFVYMTADKVFLSQQHCTNSRWINIVTEWLIHNIFFKVWFLH